MRLSTSKPAEGDYYQSEEYRLVLDEMTRLINIEKTLVRYGPGDDHENLVNESFSYDELLNDAIRQKLISDWFGENALSEILKIIG